MKNGKSGRQEPEEDLPDDQNVRNEEDVVNKEVIPWNGEHLLGAVVNQVPTCAWKDDKKKNVQFLEQSVVTKNYFVVDKEETIQTPGEAPRILCFRVDVGATRFKDTMVYEIKFSPKQNGFVMINNK